MSAAVPGPGPRAARGRRAWTVAAAVALPLVVLGLLLWALWDPQERLDTVQAAIVNHDEPVEIDGQTVPLGRQLTAGLVSGGAASSDTGPVAVQPAAGTTNYDWVVTDSADASTGLADGTYAAVVTIPENFSAAATSFGGDDPSAATQATLSVETAPGGRAVDEALARIVTTTATTVLGQTLTENYVDGVLVGFTTLNEQLGEAADGATQLADGASDANDGAVQLADGAGQVATGADQLASGVGELAAGADELAAGTSQGAGGAAALAEGAGALSGGVQGVADGAAQLSSGVAALGTGVAPLPAQATELADGAQQVSDGVGRLVQENVTGLEAAKRAAGCADDPTSDVCQRLDAQIAELRQLAGAAQQVADGNAALAGDPASSTGLYGLAAGVQQLTGASQQLADGAAQAAAGASGLATGADDLAAGLDQLDAGASGLAAGVGELSTGADQLATGTQGLATGATDLAGGVGQLADGSSDLADGLGEAVDQVPSYTDDEATHLASVVANPVEAPGTEGLGTGSTGPLFAVLALWLGALAVFVAFPPVPAQLLGSTRGAGRLALRALALPAGIGVATGLVVGGVLAAVEDASLGGWLGLLALGALSSVVFVALNQALAALLGNVGRALSLLVAVLLVATGIVATVPAALTGLRDLLPVGSALGAFTAVVEPGATGGAGDVVSLVIWGLVSVAVTTLVVARRRTVRVEQLLRA
ncbi:YhgE/Pip family protein [Cellulosimicrobium sp. PMB13]|uniref:YhgE/Pip domain-containing protein n=1 Tax=Cellulosimicrobium sp. PMB13 TaxID=3120158 RepID=UPI003F4CAAE7